MSLNSMKKVVSPALDAADVCGIGVCVSDSALSVFDFPRHDIFSRPF